MQILESPYLKPDRLAKVLALIQAMGFDERYRGTTKEWAFRAFGKEDGLKEDDLRIIFREHPEFFRDSTASPDQFALVSRRALPRRWNTLTKRLLTEDEYAALEDAVREKKVTRPRLDAEQVNKLMDIAITLHEAAFERYRDRRWVLTAILPVVTALVGAALGAFLKSS